VDIGGWPCDYDALNALVREEQIRGLFNPECEIQEQLGRILILSDAAHSIGGKYKGARVGSLTDITVYSFHAVKNLTTAEGGAVCLNLPDSFDHEEIYRALNAKALHGQTKDALAKTMIGNWRYDIIEPGYKYNMTDIQASMGMVELERYDEDMLVRRKSIFDRYSKAFRNFDWADIPLYETPERQSSYHVYMLRIKNIDETVRDAVISGIFEREVAVNVHFVPLPMMTFYKRSGYEIADFPVSYDNYSREISLPVYYDLTDEMADEVINAVHQTVIRTIKVP
jgi:dTDP-4-amino-4,6-dideoxygalactose transaminase